MEAGGPVLVAVTGLLPFLGRMPTRERYRRFADNLRGRRPV